MPTTILSGEDYQSALSRRMAEEAEGVWIPQFFITYGNNLIGHYSVLKGDDYASAREYAFEKTEGKFAFMYPIAELSRMIEDYGLTEIEIQPMDV